MPCWSGIDLIRLGARLLAASLGQSHFSLGHRHLRMGRRCINIMCRSFVAHIAFLISSIEWVVVARGHMVLCGAFVSVDNPNFFLLAPMGILAFSRIVSVSSGEKLFVRFGRF